MTNRRRSFYGWGYENEPLPPEEEIALRAPRVTPPASLAAVFWAIKSAASQAMIDAGGTITHHHALGRDHRSWYDQQRPGLFAEAFKGAKQRLDPRGVMNPGVIVDG